MNASTATPPLGSRVTLSARLTSPTHRFALFQKLHHHLRVARAVIILLMWFYITGPMLLVGAEINSQIELAAAEESPRQEEPGAGAVRLAPLPRRARTPRAESTSIRADWFSGGAGISAVVDSDRSATFSPSP